MIWTNKGHELDAIGARFKNVDQIFLYGAGQFGAIAVEKLSFLSCTISFIDRSSDKQKNGFMGKTVISPCDFIYNRDKYSNCIVVITMLDMWSIKKRLLCSGFVDGIDLFDFQWFSRFYLPIFALYRENTLYNDRLGSMITTICTLSCRYCSAGIPGKKNAHRDYNDIILEIDSIFTTYDYIDVYYLYGGEAIGHPGFRDIIAYTLGKYSDRFRVLAVLTNGFFCSGIASSLDLLKEPKVYLEWSDYTDVLDEKKVQRICDNIDLLRSEGVAVINIKYDHWIDMGEGDLLEFDENELIERFDNCSRCVNVRDKGIPVCSKAYDLSEQVLRKTMDKDYLPLRSDGDDMYRHVMLEIYYGYTEKGYPEMCRYCKGHFGINDSRVTPGEQN